MVNQIEKKQDIKKTEKPLSKKQIFRQKAKASTMKFKKELKKSTNTAIIAAFGFIIALAWKDVITQYTNRITSLSPVNSSLISAIIVTFICVVGILIVTSLISKED